MLKLLLLWVALLAPRKVLQDNATLSDAERAAQRTMATALKRGRQLANKGKHAEAVGALEAALRAVPDEPRVLNELCWEQRAMGNLRGADERCKRAARLTREPPLRAPALYNLGRLLEQQGDNPGAIAAYRKSLKLRENRYVRERLQALDPSAQSDATMPSAMDGPFASVDAWCATQQDSPCNTDPHVTQATGDRGGPWLDAKVLTAGQRPEDCVLAARTEKGWFFTRTATCYDSIFRNGVSAQIDAVDVHSAPGPELVVTFRGTDAMRDYDEERGRTLCCIEQDFEELVVCGVGPSKVPSCTPTLSLQPPLEAAGGPGLSVDWSGDELILERDDNLPLDAKKPRLEAGLKSRAGRHRITFP